MQTRRNFLKSSLWGTSLFLPSAVALANDARETESSEPYFVLMSDLHVSGDPDAKLGGPEEGLWHRKNKGYAQACVERICAAKQKPRAVLILGDLAMLHGSKIDYEAAVPVVRKFDEAGIPWHFTFGNHDRRENFFGFFPEKKPETLLESGRMVTIVPAVRNIDFVMLDSLTEIAGDTSDSRANPGSIDPAQWDFLTRFIHEKYAQGRKLVFCSHHSPGEIRGTELVEIEPNVRFWFYGHLHYWTQGFLGKHYTTTFAVPSTSFAPGWNEYGAHPIGYFEVRFREDSTLITTCTTHPEDQRNGLVWKYGRI